MLEGAGAVVGEIIIETRNIFDESDARESNGLFRLANNLHVRTKPSTIRAQLLFASGEPYLGRKLQETERVLRLLPFIYDARVVPMRYADGRVDIKVITKDVWTLSPGISFARAGGSNAFKLNLQEENLFGWGKGLQISHGATVDRTSTTLQYIDPNVFGSHWVSQLVYSDSSDGFQRSALVAQPFYSLDAPWSTKIYALDYNRTVSRYNLGEIVDQFNDNQTSFELSGGNIQRSDRRLDQALDIRHALRSQSVSADAGIDAAGPDAAARQNLSYPFTGFDILQDNYKKIGDENEIGRTEDLYFGTEISGEIGYSDTAFGANQNAVMLATKALSGFDLPHQQQLFLSGDFSTRIEEERPRNLIADIGARYYWRWRAGLAVVCKRVGHHHVPVGSGYAAAAGRRQRPARLSAALRIGHVACVVYGRAAGLYGLVSLQAGTGRGRCICRRGPHLGTGVVGNSDPGLLKDVGFGLRLGNTRSGLGNVLHIDFAFPLNNIAGIQKFQFLVLTMQSF